MASIFDTEEKQPITTMDLLSAGFRVNRKSITGGTHEAFFEFNVWAPHTGTNTWAIRFYPRGTIFKGQKLRSNRLIYKVFDGDRTRKEIDDCLMKRMRKNGATSKSSSVSKKMPRQGYCTKKYIRNIGKLEFDLVLSTVSNQFKNQFKNLK